MDNQIKEDSQSVQSHLSILQNVIQRMASNSPSSKAWRITLVSAILVIVADKGKPHYALIAIIPTLLFFVLDTYYLACNILKKCRTFLLLFDLILHTLILIFSRKTIYSLVILLKRIE